MCVLGMHIIQYSSYISMHALLADGLLQGHTLVPFKHVRYLRFNFYKETEQILLASYARLSDASFQNSAYRRITIKPPRQSDVQMEMPYS